jgi:hypothetical protein
MRPSSPDICLLGADISKDKSVEAPSLSPTNSIHEEDLIPKEPKTRLGELVSSLGRTPR